MLKPGTYRLTRNVENPKPDRRVKEDWRCHPVWEKGGEYLVEPVNHKERDDEPTSMWTRIVKVGHKWRHENFTANNGPQYQALEAALEECPMSDAAFFTAHEVREYFAQWLILSKRLTRELFLKLWAEYAEDGELNTRDPHPERVSLVEPEPIVTARYRLSIATSAVRGGYIDRDFTATDREAFEQAATEIKNGSPLVLVYKNDEQIAELRVTPAVPRTPPRVARVEDVGSPDTLEAAVSRVREGSRFIGEIVELTRDCDLGSEGDRGVVVELDGSGMRIDFSDRSVRTGADYSYLRSKGAK